MTIGVRWEQGKPGLPPPPPRIGARVHVGVNAVILGGVRIGDDAVLGAGTIVTKDVPSGASVVPAASRILRLRAMDDSDREQSAAQRRDSAATFAEADGA
ncbi:acyltransferase [Paramicrobacterium humi]|uniref:acyltransferase n=1 Tax=Paramicrobacterium humi TaxID=640635 RepID=UPI002481A887|nr:DapH/DapD/GlmU-related protein [Microbacterium humi]